MTSRAKLRGIRDIEDRLSHDSYRTSAAIPQPLHGPGDDTFQANSFDVTVADGGAGNDLLIVRYGDIGTASFGPDGEGGFTGMYTSTDGGLGDPTSVSFSSIERFDIQADGNIVTGDGDDTIVATGASSVTAGGGNDAIDGSTGNDTIDAGAGNDTVTQTGGTENVDLGGGEDRLILDYDTAPFSGGSLMTLVDQGGGSYSGTYNSLSTGAPDISFQGVEHFTISTREFGGNGVNLKDDIVTGDGDDSIVTFGSDDRIDVGRGVDSVDGGVSIDGLAKEFGLDAPGIDINLLANTYSGPGSYTNLEYFIDLRTGDAGDVVVTTNANGTSGGLGDDLIFTRGGDDVVTLLDGADTVDLGDGDDRLVMDYTTASFTNNTAMTLNGNGSYSGSFAGTHSNAFSVAFAGVEHFTISTMITGGNGTNLMDAIVTGNGDDIIATYASNDTIRVGRGVDSVDGGVAIDGLAKEFEVGAPGIDINLLANTYSGPGSYANLEYFIDLRTGNAADVIVTSATPGASTAGVGDDLIDSRGGDDEVTLLDGQDTVDMGTGEDRLILDYRTASFTSNTAMTLVNDGGGSYSGTFAGTPSGPTADFTGVEHFTILTLITGGNGTNLVDSVLTGKGDDIIFTYASNDTIAAGAGADFVDGGISSDSIDAGSGDDTLVGGTSADTLIGGAGIDLADFGAAAAGVSLNLKAGGSGGEAAGDSYSGIENVRGSAHADNVVGDKFANRIEGLAGDDALRGAKGDDTLAGAEGRDTLTGSRGDDRFDLASLDAADADRILDFGNDDDIFGLDSDVFGLPEGALVAARFRVGAQAGDALDRLIYNDATGKLFFDADGDGAGEQVLIATLSGAPTLSAADFVVI